MDEYKQTPPAAAVHGSSSGTTPEGGFHTSGMTRTRVRPPRLAREIR